MPIKDYGVFIGYPLRYDAEKDDSTPHLQLFYSSEPQSTQTPLRAAINIKSSTSESRLVYWFVRDLSYHPVVTDLAAIENEPGFHALESDGPPALDFIRGNLVDLQNGTLLRHNVEGEKNDIVDFISPVLDEAISRGAKIFLFGQQFPGGIHDIHMNQGNEGRFKKDNGIYQDGGLILHFPDDDHWEGVFLAFGVQKVHTDDASGNPIDPFIDFVQLLKPDPRGTDTEPETGTEGTVLIRAALLNPVGDDGSSSGEREAIDLINVTASPINLDGWTVVNRNRDEQRLRKVVLKPGAVERFAVPDCPLSNQGGTLSLLDERGLKVDGVSWSKKQAKREGALVWFH